MLSFCTRSFHQLSTSELYELLKLRSKVFVAEQHCVYQDVDGKDPLCLHVMGTWNEQLIAYARLVPGGLSYKEPAIGRVLVHADFRALGYGKLLMQYSMEETIKHFRASIIVISAQRYLETFYRNLGFVTEGAVYPEDGIPHIKMRYGL